VWGKHYHPVLVLRLDFSINGVTHMVFLMASNGADAKLEQVMR
jgi:hypothetical protein